MSQTTLNTDSPRTLDSRAADAGAGRVLVDTTRPRQTEVQATPFRAILAGGVSVLMGGAAVATHVMGAPALAAAISGARSRATGAITAEQPGTPRDRSVPSDGNVSYGSSTPQGVVADGAAAVGAAGSAAAGAVGGAGLPAGTGADAGDLATMQAMQRESQVFNMQLLGLQEEVQQENRRFTTLSNVLRAKHDTAKAAVSNIRS